MKLTVSFHDWLRNHSRTRDDASDGGRAKAWLREQGTQDIVREVDLRSIMRGWPGPTRTTSERVSDSIWRNYSSWKKRRRMYT